jgi:hypothetical protein
LVGKTGFPQRPIEKLTGAIARKHAAGSIRAVRSGGKTHNEEARVRIPKTGYRPAPIGLATVGAPLDPADLFAVSHQAGAAETVDDFVIQYLQFSQKAAPAAIIVSSRA